MIDQLPALIVLAPLIGAMITGLAGPNDRRVCFPIVFCSLLAALLAAIGAAVQVFTTGPIDYFVGGWEEPLGIGIHLRIDAINAFVLIVIGVVALLVSIFSIRRIGDVNRDKTPQFYVLFQLLCVGVFGITIAGDAFNLFVLIEVSSLTSYALIAMGSSRRGTHAAFNYILMGTIGASFYLLGVGYLYLMTGTLNMQGIREVLANNAAIADSPAVTIAFLFILVGIWIKMAFFPLYGWLPNAYSYAPSACACLLAPLMTKVSVYVMIRVMLSVFGEEWVFVHLGWTRLVVLLAVIAILAGSLLALQQREIKKMLCYLIVAEVGYMVGGAWLTDENHWGLTGALYHIPADALMTLCLFVAAGIFSKRLGATRIDQLEGFFHHTPVTAAGFVVGALAMIGVPPTCGFFSKFYLIRGGIEGGHWLFVAALILSSLANAVLFFRIFEIGFFGKRPPQGHGSHADWPRPQGELAHATPTTLIPLVISAVLVVLLGIFNGPVVALIRVAFETVPEVASHLPVLP